MFPWSGGGGRGFGAPGWQRCFARAPPPHQQPHLAVGSQSSRALWGIT